MMKTVISQDCFVDENVRELKIMGTASFVIAAAFLVKTIFGGNRGRRGDYCCIFYCGVVQLRAGGCLFRSGPL